MRKLLLAASPVALSAPHIGHLAAYANAGLTALIPTLYAGMNIVSRELVGFLPSVSRNVSVERAAVGQSIAWPIAPALASFDITPSMQVSEPPDITFENNSMTLTKARAVPFGWTGEEQRGLNNAGPGYSEMNAQLFAQALRTLVNEMEADVALEASLNGSRAFGTAGTTPFGTEKLTDVAGVQKILDDNGAPETGRSLVINTSAAANLVTMYNLTRANEAGTTMTLRQGELLDLLNFSIKKSAKIPQHVAGTAASATTNAAGYAVGATTITLASAGTGTVVVGDTITFAGDTNKYQVVTGDTSTADGGTLVIARPGLRVAIPAAATAITVATAAGGVAHNVAFTQDALRFAMRPPAIPVEGDLRIDSTVISDPRSGMSFEVSIWPGQRKVRYEIAAVWGQKAVKREHIAILLG